MSEYQYYEWQAIDRPLTENQLTEVNRLSSHMDVVTSTQAVVTYSWGDFKHDPQDVLLKYFDAFLYLTNWGSRRLMFRFPKASIDAKAIQAYCLGDWMAFTATGPYYILEISLDEEDSSDWVEGSGVLGQLTPLREHIIQGDYRGLYLAWLKTISIDQYFNDEEDDEFIDDRADLFEPPLPAGLQELTGSLEKFIDFFEIDPYLVKAAAQASPTLKPSADESLLTALSLLPRVECEDYLRRLLQNEPQVNSALRKRLIELSGGKQHKTTEPSRPVQKLFQAAQQEREKAKRQAKAEADRKRIAALNELAKREESTWRSIDSLIEQKQARPYGEAVGLLVKLRDLAIYQKKLPEFERRFENIHMRCAKRPTLMERFRKAGLLED